MPNTAIEFIHVNKTFPGSGVEAVRDVNLRIDEGTIVTILGTSGSGKTTLLKLINRIYDCTRGRVEYFGEDVSALPVVELRRKIGYVIQQSGLFPHWTVEKNIATLPRILKWDKRRIDERVDELLELVHLDPECRTRAVQKLSGGQQQRVGLARALAISPSVILMDEPFGAIDAITRENLQNELLSLQDRLKTTVVFVTHSVQEALKLGHKIVVMDNGEIRQEDSAYNILLRPANDFVRKLVSTDDFYDALRVLRAKECMDPLDREGEFAAGAAASENRAPTVRQDAPMSDALQALINCGEKHLIVVDAAGRPIGKLSIESYRNVAAQAVKKPETPHPDAERARPSLHAVGEE
jgi:osmoprotectant transport system ATP-binding protein